MGQIVVGVDGSTNSRAALRWALDEAQRRGATVAAVAAWNFPTYAYTGVAVAPPTAEIEQAAREGLAEAVREEVTAVAGEHPSVEITQVVLEGPPAATLIEASRDAELLVVGSRGLGGFRGLLLGSVSHQVSSHAHCPVVVVPHDLDE
ncbi:MAG TPA: universal stress protein [Acidimicrobiales bacterium]|nr:universal stress protein [Acidimicrobiales bacterium]